MTLDEIIKKQKEHLTNAQIKSLAAAAERYKQITAAQRAQAYSSTRQSLNATRRGLQNAGLASRRGKLISGVEKAAQDSAEEAYRGYNAQLAPVANAYVEHQANSMARETMIDEQLQKMKEYQEALAEYHRKRREYEAAAARQREAEQRAAAQAEQQMMEWNNQMTDPRLQNQSSVDRANAAAARQRANGNAMSELTDPRLGGNAPARRQALEQQRQLTEELYRQYRRAVYPNLTDPRESVNKEDRFGLLERTKIERELEEKAAQWDKDIAAKKAAEASEIPNARDSVAKHNRSEAIRKGKAAMEEKASMLSRLARINAAASVPAQYRNLYLMSDDEFSVAYDAAQKRYEQMRNEANADQRMSGYNADPREAESRRQKRDALLKQADEWFAPYRKIAEDRDHSDVIPFMADEVTISDAKRDKKKQYASTWEYVNDNQTNPAGKGNYLSWASIWASNGNNWSEAKARGWEATDYANKHDVKGSRFAALVNEWSIINGRTALSLYSPSSSIFGKSTNYEWFRNECVMAFNHNFDTSGTKEQKEQMQAMLTLANLMTDEERAKFNGLLYQVNAETADKYFEYLYNSVLPKRFANFVNDANQMSMDGNASGSAFLDKVAASGASVLYNLTQGVTGPIHNIGSNQTDPVAALLTATQYNKGQGIRNAVMQDMGKWGNFAYSTAMSMADSSVVAAISHGIGNALQGVGVAAAKLATKVGSVIGGSLLGGSAYNSSYQEALERGLTPDKARATALGTGINEMLFESLSLELLVGHFQKGGLLKVSRNAGVNWIVNTLASAGVEGSEEVFTDIANRIWDNNVNGIFAEELQKIRDYVANGMTYEQAKRKVDKEFAEQLGMSFLGGAISGGVMGGGATFMGMVQTRQLEKIGKSVRTDTESMNGLTSFDFKSKEAQEILKQGKLTDTDLGTLAVIQDQELAQKAHDYAAQLVKDGKITAEVQKLIDKFIDNPGLAESQNGGLVDFNGKEVLSAKEVAQLAPYEKYLQNAIDIRGNAEALMNARQAQEEKLDNPLITNEERAQRIGQEFAPAQQDRGLRSQIAGDLNAQRAAANATSANPNVNKSIIEGMRLKETVKVKGNRVNTTNGKVTFDYGNNKTTDNMTNDELIALRVAQYHADRSGSNIHVESEFVGKDKNADGFYNPETDTVHINLKGKNSMIYTLAHELTHRIAKLNKAGYADLLKAVKEELSRTDLTGDRLPEMYQDAIGQYMDGETSIMDALRKYEREHYRQQGIILDKNGGTTEVDEEIVCKCCETFLADPRFVQSMVEMHKKGAKAVYSFIKDVYNDFKALFNLAERNADAEGLGNAANISPESDILRQFGDIERIYKLWTKAMRQMQKSAAKTGKLSIAPISDTVSSEMNTKFSVRTEAAPTKTQDVYKLMRLGKDGRLYPLFIDSAEGIDVGVWYNADSPDMSVLKTLPSGVYLIGNDGNDIVTLADYQREHGEKSSKFPSKAAINSAATDGKRWVYIEDVAKGQRRYGGENRKYWNLGVNGSGSVSTFAMRPGWHAGSLPTMRQIGKGANKNLRDDSFVWVKGRVSADVDYQAEAERNPDNDIPTHIPTNGFYMKATNPNAAAAQTDKVGWYIAGAFIADRIIGDAEARSIIDKWNESHPSDRVEYDYERENGGVFDAETMSIRPAQRDNRYSITTAVKTAIENNGVVVNEKGEPVLNVIDHGDGVQYSYSTYRDGGRDVLKTFMKKDIEKYANERRKALRAEGKTKAEIKSIVDADIADMRTQYERIMKQMDKIYEMSTKYLDKYASFGTWSRAAVTVGEDGKPVFSVIRSNGEYPMNIDFSLVCVKRRALDAVMNEIVKNGYMEKLVLDGESLVKVNNILRRRGFEVACMGCFVEAKRFRQQKVAEDFAEKYNEIVKSLGGEAAYANFGQDETVKQTEGIANKKDSELNWTRVNELIAQYEKKKAANSRAGKTVEEAIAFELKENPKSRVLLKSGDFMSTRGMDRVAEVAPSILSLYNKQKGTGGPKAVFGDMQYLNDIFKKQWNVNKAYAVGGVRVQSFSDFVPRMFFDYCQMVADLATRKLPAHAYTKEESFVKLFGLTGMKINMSLFPKVGSDGLAAGLQYKRSKNGDIVYKNGKPVITYAWAGESFDYEKAKEIQADAKYGKNCGTIAVGISDEQIRMMMADPTIRMIIPYHKSSLNPIIAELMGIDGFTDYTDFQRTKKDGTAIDVDFAFNERLHEVGDVQKVVKEYLDWCKENGYTAKFEQFAYNADGSINENYYKLLEDFSLFDEQGNYCPQEAVQMVYPDSDSAFGSMDALLDEYLKRDNDLQEARDAMIPAIAQDIIREVDKKHSLSNTDFKTDKLGNTEYLKYLQLGKKVVNQTATEDEIREFKRRMNELSEDNRMGFLDRLREKLIRDDEGAKVREIRDRQIARLKAEFRESREKAREARVRRDIVNVLKNGNDRIVKLLANPKENAYVPVQLAQAVAEYAQRLNELLTTSVPKSGENAGIEQQTKKGELNARKIIDALNRSYADKETIDTLRAEDPNFDPRGLLPVQYDEHGNVIKDDTLIKMIEGMDSIIHGKHLTDLTTEELQFVMNTMRGVIHAVTEANKVTLDGEKRTVYRTSRKMASEVNNAAKVFGNKSNKITKFLNRYVIESLGLRRIAKLYSGSNENAIFVKMVDDLNQGALEQERIKQTLRGMFNEVTSKYAKDMETWYGKKAEWIDTGFGFKITKGMRVSLAMHILNAQNLRNVEKAGLRIPEMSAYRKGNIKEAYKKGKVVRLTKEQAQQIVDNMTEAEKAYYEVAKEFFHKRSGYYINKTSLKLLGYSKAIVENYFPIQTDDAYRTVKYDDVRQTASVEHPGFLETRKGTANVMFLNDITAVVNRQIDGVAKYAGLAIPMRTWNNIMNAWLFEENENGEWVRSDEGRVHDVLERRMGYTNGNGHAIIDYVDQFIADLTSPGMRDANENVQAAEFAARITSNYVKAVLTLNARVALSQLASVPTAAAEIPWKYLVQSFGGNVEQHLNRNASNELIDQYTPIFAMRRAGTQTEVSEVMKRRGFADKAEQKLPGLLGWITAMDVAATRRLWYACERWVKGETALPVGSDEFYKEVARRYERVIQNTQPNFTVLQRSPALRSKNAAARIITMFGTQRMQNAGVFIESFAEVVQAQDKTQKKAALKKFGRVLSGAITAALVIGLERSIVAALRGRMKPLQDDDKNITVKSVSKYIMNEVGTTLAGSFMYVGEIYDFVHGIVSGLTEGDSGYETSFALPAAEALSTIIGFFRDKDWQYFKYMRGDHTDHEKWLKTRSFVNELMTVVGYATGLPLANASKTILNGWVPLAQDISDAIKTGELNLYLNQSGKLDAKTTAANYKEWTNAGFKGSEYFYWEKKLSEYGKRDEKIPILLDSDLPDEKKAMLLRMMDKSGATSDGTKVFKKNGDLLIDFANPTEKQQALPMPEPREAPSAEPSPTAEPTPKPTENPLTDARQEGVKEAVAKGVPEQTAFDAFLTYQDMGKNKDEEYSRNDEFREWLFKNVDSPEQRAILEYQVIGTAAKVEGSVTYRDSGVVYRDYTNEAWFKLSQHNLAKDGTNKRYDAGKKLEKTGLSVDKTVAIYDGLAQYSKKAEWKNYLKEQGLSDEQITIFLWSRGWAKLK